MNDNRSFPDITFVETDTEALITSLISTYEQMSGKTLYPASPERIFILWVSSIITQLRELINWSAKQNVPRFAKGEYLDSLSELFKSSVERLDATAATTTIRFYISQALLENQSIPVGTRVTVDGTITFKTTEEKYVAAGNLYVDIPAVCQTAGVIGNGFAPGQISILVDVFPYYDHCANITTSAGGSAAEDDDSFYQRLRDSEDTFSTAGSANAYMYYARTVNPNISDVKIVSPSAGVVNVYILLKNGEIPDSEILTSVQEVLSADDIRPLTDYVTVMAPSVTNYDIEFTYYMPVGSAKSTADFEADIIAAVNAFKIWQSEKMGRDINPSMLVSMLMATGIKRVVMTTPVYCAVDDNEVAIAQDITIVNGGYEGE